MDYAAAIFTNAAIYIIATMGLAIFTGYTGLFSLGHAAFMAVGAYAAAICTHFLKLPLAVGLVVGIILAVLSSLIIGYPTLRARLPWLVPLRRVAVAALLLVREQVAAARKALPAGGAAERDRRAEARLSAVVVAQALVIIEVPLRLERRGADLAVVCLG